MKIFITGTNGFVGKNLCEFYSQHEIFKFTRDMNIAESLNHFKPDVIINSAAEIYKNDSMWDSNVILTKECVEYVKHNPNTKMLQIGSSIEYGSLTRPGKETDRINPSDMYQTTKGISTLLCQGYARIYNLNINVVRPYSVYGPHEKPHRLFPKLWKAFNLNQAMTLFDGYHDFIYIDDFVHAIDTVIQKGTQGTGDIINCGSGVQISNIEVLDLFKKITGKTAPVTFENKLAKQFESNIWVCDTSYAFEKYGFKTQFSLEQGIKKFLETAIY
jgi:nucleoside-diphosphate-sugar epimerase